VEHPSARLGRAAVLDTWQADARSTASDGSERLPRDSRAPVAPPQEAPRAASLIAIGPAGRRVLREGHRVPPGLGRRLVRPRTPAPRTRDGSATARAREPFDLCQVPRSVEDCTPRAGGGSQHTVEGSSIAAGHVLELAFPPVSDASTRGGGSTRSPPRSLRVLVAAVRLGLAEVPGFRVDARQLRGSTAASAAWTRRTAESMPTREAWEMPVPAPTRAELPRRVVGDADSGQRGGRRRRPRTARSILRRHVPDFEPTTASRARRRVASIQSSTDPSIGSGERRARERLGARGSSRRAARSSTRDRPRGPEERAAQMPTEVFRHRGCARALESAPSAGSHLRPAENGAQRPRRRRASSASRNAAVLHEELYRPLTRDRRTLEGFRAPTAVLERRVPCRCTTPSRRRSAARDRREARRVAGDGASVNAAYAWKQ
jgi:hypothetical protein